MTADYNLAAILTVLLSRDKADASDLAERIQKREIRVVAHLVLAIDAFETALKEFQKKAAEKKAGPK